MMLRSEIWIDPIYWKLVFLKHFETLFLPKEIIILNYRHHCSSKCTIRSIGSINAIWNNSRSTPRKNKFLFPETRKILKVASLERNFNFFFLNFARNKIDRIPKKNFPSSRDGLIFSPSPTPVYFANLISLVIARSSSDWERKKEEEEEPFRSTRRKFPLLFLSFFFFYERQTTEFQSACQPGTHPGTLMLRLI